MKRRATTGGKVGKARRRKTQISRVARVVARRGSSDASLREQLDQSRRERDEALEQQAATSEVLNAIRNSPSNTQPVFDAIVRSGLKLFANAAITIALPQGGQVVAGAIADADPKRAEALRRRLPIPLRREFMHSLAIIDGKIVDVPDADNPPAHLASGAKNFRASGFRAVTIVPMMQSGTAIGALSVARVAPGPLSDKQNAILQTFAAQAVIAIENAWLLNELRQRTDDLSESLEQQTATSQVLQVISSSPGELEPVFKSMLVNAVRICEAGFGALWLFDGKAFRAGALHRVPDAFVEFWKGEFRQPTPDSALGRVVRTKQAVQIADLKAEPGYAKGDLMVVAGVELARIDRLSWCR